MDKHTWQKTLCRWVLGYAKEAANRKRLKFAIVKLGLWVYVSQLYLSTNQRTWQDKQEEGETIQQNKRRDAYMIKHASRELMEACETNLLQLAKLLHKFPLYWGESVRRLFFLLVFPPCCLSCLLRFLVARYNFKP